MSYSINNALPQGIKQKHLEQRSLRRCPPLPFVPPQQETVTSKPLRITITIQKDKVGEQVQVLNIESAVSYLAFS